MIWLRREYSPVVMLGIVMLQPVVGAPALYAFSAYAALVLALGRVIKPMARRIRKIAVELYASGEMTTARYNEVAILVNSILSQGPPLPGDTLPMSLR